MTRDFIVHKNGAVQFSPGSIYGPDCNWIEERIKRIQFLRAILDKACDDLAINGEIQTGHADQIVALSDAAYEPYNLLISAGIQVADFDRWWTQERLQNIQSRPICGHELGLLPGEGADPRFPGWDYRHPGYWYKAYQGYSIGIDNWEGVRVFVYASRAHEDGDQPEHCVEIAGAMDLAILEGLIPEAYNEVCDIISKLQEEE